jgi:hypothetical protein
LAFLLIAGRRTMSSLLSQMAADRLIAGHTAFDAMLAAVTKPWQITSSFRRGQTA